MTRKLLLKLSLVFAIASIAVMGTTSLALARDTPLVTIRFNTNAVAYEESLEKAIKMAQHVKSDVFFDIVAIAPETKNKKYNSQLDTDVRFHTAKITDQLTQAGVGRDMIRTTFQQNKFLKNNEIQIFVQ